MNIVKYCKNNYTKILNFFILLLLLLKFFFIIPKWFINKFLVTPFYQVKISTSES
jgi:hypothetical protein